MTLPVSPSAIYMSQFNTELGLSSSASITLNDTAVRALLGKPTTQSEIYFSDGHGKSAAKLTFLNPITVLTSGLDKIALFPSSNTITVTGGPVTVRALVVAGGGGGDYRYQSGGGGGGGGGVNDTNITLSVGTYNVVIGAGGVGNGTTLAGATGSSSSVSAASSTGGLPSGYSSGYNYGRGGTPNGANGGLIAGGAGSNGPTVNITDSNVIYGSGGGAGGTTGGAGGSGAGTGGSSYQYGTNGSANRGGGAGGGGWYSGGTYYYGGAGGSGYVVIRGQFNV